MTVIASNTLGEAIGQVQRLLTSRGPDAAAALAADAVRRGLKHPLLFHLAAWERERASDFGAAGALLNQARALAPGEPAILTAIGRVLVKEGRAKEALAPLDAALKMRPDFAPAWHDRGAACATLNDRPAAAAAFRNAVRCNPRLADSYAGLASVRADDQDWVEVRWSAAQALALDPGQRLARLMLARADLAEGDLADAAEGLGALLSSPDLDPDTRASALTLLGDVYDRQGRPGEAFAAFARAQAIDRQVNRPRFGDGGPVEDHGAFALRIAAAFALAPAGSWQAPGRTLPPGPAQSHVFLLGYPRSGTTLIESVLLAADGVEAVEEQPVLIEADEAFLWKPSGMDRLGRLQPDEIEAFRASYWRRVREAGAQPDGKVFIDMYPLNSVKLPLIAKLFPEARILVARRDPRDVVLSCFRRRFALSAAGYAFTDLRSAARHFDTVAGLLDRYLQELPVAYHVVPYADLVSDFDAATKAMCDFVGLRWSPALRDFSAGARKRQVRTMSAGQVRRSLYDGGGQWRAYREQLAPVLPILEPWVLKWSLPVTPSRAAEAA